MAPPPHTHTHTHTNTDMTCDYSGPRTSMNRRFVVPGRPLSPPLSLRLTEKQICSRVSLWWCVSSPPTKLHCHSFPFLFQVLCSINSWQVSVKQGWSTAGSTYTSSEPPPPPFPIDVIVPILVLSYCGLSWALVAH
jgi:hypothetical protein